MLCSVLPVCLAVAADGAALVAGTFLVVTDFDEAYYVHLEDSGCLRGSRDI